MILEGKTAVITGGGSGMGRATALLFAKEGADVVISGRTGEKLTDVANEVKDQTGKEIMIAQGDVSVRADAKRLAEETINKFNKIDILINNAGIFRSNEFNDTETDEWNEVMNTNLNGVFYVTKEILPYMLENKGGSIINISSILGMVAVPNTAAYNTSKGGVVLFTKSLAVEYAGRNIRANCICPGLVATPMTKDFMAQKEVMAEIIKDYPMGRFGKAEDIAYPCLFFAADWSSWITGAVLPVDGGYTAK